MSKKNPKINKQVRKRLRQSRQKRDFNKSQISALKTMKKKVINSSNSQSISLFSKYQQQLDRLARKGIIHPNKAKRQKVKMSTRLKAISQ